MSSVKNSWTLAKKKSSNMTTTALAEQRAITKFCVKLKKTAAVTMQMTKDAGMDSNAGKTTVYKWHNGYGEGRESLCDDAVG